MSNWAVIMAGGRGERFWPMSRAKLPKHLLPIVGKKTMIQETVARLRPLFDNKHIMVITTQQQLPVMRRQLPKLGKIAAEPMGRDTAPCVALAAAMVGALEPDGVMAMLPADHVIRDGEKYLRVLNDALELARREKVLVTIGIQPTQPHTGFGYIHVGDELKTPDLNTKFWRARRFVEKPDRSTAEQYLASGEYRWNAGMFVWSVAALRDAIQKFQPEIAKRCAKISDAVGKKSFTRVLKREYAAMPRISIDYALMEKADNVVVANGDFDWDDLGDWAAVARHFAKDEHGNVAQGAKFVGLDAKNCIVVSKNPKKIIAAVGVDDVVVVETPDATLICRRDQSQKVRELVKKLSQERKLKKYL
jgi:mannose-1-phosphate guanylyltransferase